jgi:hypothetical protein
MEQITEIPFSEEHLQEIAEMVEAYNNLYKDLQELETWVQHFLAEQKKVVESLTEIRKYEEIFFINTSKELGIPAETLKKMASNIAASKED